MHLQLEGMVKAIGMCYKEAHVAAVCTILSLKISSRL